MFDRQDLAGKKKKTQCLAVFDGEGLKITQKSFKELRNLEINNRLIHCLYISLST